MKKINQCLVCGAKTNFENILTQRVIKDDLSIDCEIVRCSSCGHQFLNPQPENDELSSFYAKDYHVFNAPLMDDKQLGNFIKTHFDTETQRFNHAKYVKGGRYVDLGCGLGDMVAAMSRLGMEAYGLDPSPSAVEQAQKSGRNVELGYPEDNTYEKNSFDSISLYHSLEHTSSPIEVLKHCARLLKHDGELMVAVPNIDSLGREIFKKHWSHLSLPYHLHHFNKSSLELAANKAGLVLTEILTESINTSMEKEIAALARRQFFIPLRLSLKFRWFLPVARWLTRRSNRLDRGDAIVAFFKLA